MNNVLCNLIGLKCLVYLDDIIIFSVDLVELNKRIRKYLTYFKRKILSSNGLLGTGNMV